MRERENQDVKWGEQNWPTGTGAACYEMQAKIRKAICNDDFDAGTLTWRAILLEEVYEALAELPGPGLREELIQCAAVCVAMVESLDRNGK